VLAEAALVDTLDAALRTGARVVLALDGEPGDWLPPSVEIIAQRGDGLDRRIAGAFEDVGAPAILIGMDTPQITPWLLGDAIRSLERPDVDAVLGTAYDGGWWAAGLRRPDRRAFEGVPMSTSRTGAAQARRLHALGLRTARLPQLRDVDRIEDAHAVATGAPWSRFAAALSTLPAARLAG
jgi:hypothetical protein